MIDFLLLAQTYILRNQRAKAWRAALMAARIAQARHDERMQQACLDVVETISQL